MGRHEPTSKTTNHVPSDILNGAAQLSPRSGHHPALADRAEQSAPPGTRLDQVPGQLAAVRGWQANPDPARKRAKKAEACTIKLREATAAESGTIAAREALARDFYRNTGWDEARISKNLRGIDFSQPVDVVTLPKGTKLSQWNYPGEMGNYYTDLGAGPENLGVYTRGRVESVVSLQDDMQALRSITANATDTWSVPPNEFSPGLSVEAPGGGIQYFIIKKK